MHSGTGTATFYHAGGWQAFTNDMELLPGTYPFQFDDGTPQTNESIVAGAVNDIH